MTPCGNTGQLLCDVYYIITDVEHDYIFFNIGPRYNFQGKLFEQLLLALISCYNQQIFWIDFIFFTISTFYFNTMFKVEYVADILYFLANSDVGHYKKYTHARWASYFLSVICPFRCSHALPLKLHLPSSTLLKGITTSHNGIDETCVQE